jgi:Domain of Unknown Function (DUF1259)
MRAVQILIACGLIISTAAAADAQGIDWSKIDATFGRTAAVSGEIHRYGFPRTDLQVTLDGVTIRPAFALGGWIAFEPMRDTAMVMGDLVLLQTEVNPVRAASKLPRSTIISCAPSLCRSTCMSADTAIP